MYTYNPGFKIVARIWSAEIYENGNRGSRRKTDLPLPSKLLLE
jgi:hypothetical protein